MEELLAGTSWPLHIELCRMDDIQSSEMMFQPQTQIILVKQETWCVQE